jgi:hypothetical protein
MFRKLRADEIEVRVGSVMKGAATLLLYKDARCDMNILDETVGVMGWKREHTRDNANCTVSIWDSEKEQWISKEDTGTESQTEREKGLASDSFKRACVNWGIGRELYTAPRIKIRCETKEKQSGRGYELANRWEFFGAYVSRIAYDGNGNICTLEIMKDGKQLYWFDNDIEHYPDVEKGMEDMQYKVTKEQAQTVMQMADEYGVARSMILKYYKIEQFTDLTKEQYGDALNRIKAESEKR